MRILVLTLNAWNQSNSTGNTISNLFSKLNDNDAVANIYCRNEIIDNTICNKYFKITEKDILRSLFRIQRCGNIVKYNGSNYEKDNLHIHTNSIKLFIKKHRFTTLLLLREFIWSIPVWKNNKLKSFVKEFAPDIIYMHGHYNLYMHKLLAYCQKISGAKVVMYWGDDMYGRKSYAPLSYLYESMLRKRFRKSISSSSLLLGGSLQLCDEYSKLFKKTFVPFFKECKRIGRNESKIIGKTISIVYAGNLLFGREEIIKQFVLAIKKVNSLDLAHNFKLKIYSNSQPSADSLAIINDTQNSFFLGCKPYPVICEELDKSDLALFIESFNKKNILSTRLSFSTKIIDCMQSTAAILAIGPNEIASIEYIKSNNLGYTITDVEDIVSRLTFLANNTDIINIINQRKADFAERFHTKTSVKALSQMRNII